MTMKSLMILLVKSENSGCLTELNHFLKRDYAIGGPGEQNIVTYGDGHPMNPSKGGIGFSSCNWEFSLDYDGGNWPPGQPSLICGNAFKVESQHFCFRWE
jgi:hypothetical protein